MHWLLANWLALLAAIFAFGLVVFVHESGHFFIARYVGVTVHEFSLGFGPQVFRRQRGVTEYSIRAVPLGGYVRMEGEDTEGNKDDPGNFQNKNTWQKMAVIVGGCLMNYLSAFLVYTVIGVVQGVPVFDATMSTRVSQVIDDMPAAAAGIKSGDKIVSIDGKPMNSFNDIVSTIGSHPNQSIDMTVDRGGQAVTLKVTPQPADDVDEKGNPTKVGRIGITPEPNPGTVTFAPAVGGVTEVMATYWQLAGRLTMTPIYLIKNLVSGREKVSTVRKQMSGPVGIGQLLVEAAGKGIWPLAAFWSVISTLVGGFNLLPVPALDGARGFIVLIGAIRRRPVDQDKEALVHTVGLAVLLTLVLVLTVQDIQKLHSGFHMLQ
ncbi:MAG TPA: M50 family metallopeptidase [Candidatus Xenobia bacterium]|jgi:regulator of sigma E protease